MYVGFKFCVLWRDADAINLGVSAWNGTFGGLVEIYEGTGDLRDAAARLRGFPKEPADMRELVFGNFDRNFAGGGVRMRFHCVDGAGHAYVEATFDSNCKSGGTVQTVVLAMPVEAAAVDTFVQELERLEDVGAGSAHLKGKGSS